MTHDESRRLRKAIAEFVKDTQDVREACKRFEVSTTYVRTSCREHGVTITRPPIIRVLHISTYKIIALLVTSDMSLRQIAKELSTSPQRISDVAKQCIKAGIPIRSHDE
jgi:transposase